MSTVVRAIRWLFGVLLIVLAILVMVILWAMRLEEIA